MVWLAAGKSTKCWLKLSIRLKEIKRKKVNLQRMSLLELTNGGVVK